MQEPATWRGMVPSHGIQLKVEAHDDGLWASVCDLSEDWSPMTKLESVSLGGGA